MKPDTKTLYQLSLYFISSVITLTFFLAVVDNLWLSLEWWGMQIGIFALSLYSFLTLRQLYTHGRTWPRRALLFAFPLSFSHVLLDVPIPYAVGLCAFNLLFWYVAFRLSNRLVKLSPYGGPSGDL